MLMKNLFLIIFLAIFSFSFPISCKKDERPNIKIENKDTLFLKENTILFISPSVKKFEELKKQYGEDYYTIADDANYYYSNATGYLDSLKEKYLNLNENIIIAYKDGLKTKVVPKQKNNWYSILYNKKKLKIIDLVNFKKEHTLFFNDTSTLEEKLKIWYGTYLNTDSEKLNSYESIMEKIGWYRLSIKSDEIIFESDRRMETDFPTEAPGGIYINYICDYKITGDTIKLFKKNNVTNKHPLEINTSNNKPILILYKKDNTFYGISDDIKESEELDNSIRVKEKSPYIFKKF